MIAIALRVGQLRQLNDEGNIIRQAAARPFADEPRDA
jgi:hypothetical protein